jgi:serine phosphatase RsbU (regulator of sigma subunit)
LYDEWNGTPYVTCLIARIDLDRRSLTYTNAGHPSGLLFREHGDRHLSEGGPPLGLLRDAQYSEERVELRDGDVCILMTDGVTESFDDARPLGKVGQPTSFVRTCHGSAHLQRDHVACARRAGTA